MPKAKRDGEHFAFVDRKHVRKQSELALTLFLMGQRKLFGEVYSGLCPEYFWSMPKNSGALLAPIVTTSELWPSALRPGDIDLLVVPYEENRLMLDRTLALEIKIIRASFAKPGKSPNEFGFSQANSLSEIGFPYSGVLHLIVSDESPEEAWRPMKSARVLDDQGNLELLPDVLMDVFPMDLINRAYGRMVQRCPNQNIGLAALYLENWKPEKWDISPSGNYWMPNCRAAAKHSTMNVDLMNRIGEFYVKNAAGFLATPRYDP